VARLDRTAADHEKLLLEVIGVFEAHESPSSVLLGGLANAKDFRVRAYAARVAGAWANRLPEAASLLREQVRDGHPRVRLEAVVGATLMEKPEAIEIVAAALENPTDRFLDYAIRAASRALQPHWGPLLESGKLHLGSTAQEDYLKKMASAPKPVLKPGQPLYEMACLACHQPEGKGLPGVYPPLAGSQWVAGSPEPLIKVILHGLSGPIKVAGQIYGNGQNAIPMPGMAGLTDQQIVDVINYVRSEFAGGSSSITVEEVKKVRSETAARDRAWTAAELGFDAAGDRK
jgi:mono/diheme cytochrome c family protein